MVPTLEETVGPNLPGWHFPTPHSGPEAKDDKDSVESQRHQRSCKESGVHTDAVTAAHPRPCRAPAVPLVRGLKQFQGHLISPCS